MIIVTYVVSNVLIDVKNSLVMEYFHSILVMLWLKHAIGVSELQDLQFHF